MKTWSKTSHTNGNKKSKHHITKRNKLLLEYFVQIDSVQWTSLSTNGCNHIACFYVEKLCVTVKGFVAVCYRKLYYSR